MGSHSAPKGSPGRSLRSELTRPRARRARQKGSLAARVFVWYWLFYGLIAVRSGMSDHLTIGYYLYSLLFWFMLPVAGISIIVAAERVAAMSKNEPPRWAFAVLALCFLSPMIITIADAIRLHGQRPSWWPGGPLERAVEGPVALCLAWTLMLAVLMIGRASLQGRLRERCWLCLPNWLTRAPRA